MMPAEPRVVPDEQTRPGRPFDIPCHQRQISMRNCRCAQPLHIDAARDRAGNAVNAAGGSRGPQAAIGLHRPVMVGADPRSGGCSCFVRYRRLRIAAGYHDTASYDRPAPYATLRPADRRFTERQSPRIPRVHL